MLVRTFFAVWISLLSWTSLSAPYRVLIDPGHGGQDDGAVRNDIREADLVLKISKKILNLLEEDPHFDAQLTRSTTGATLSLKDRVVAAENFDADLFISVHANASTNPRVRGAEFYFSPALSAQESALWLSHLSVQAQKELASSEERTKDLTSDVAIILHEIKDQQRAWESQELSRALWRSWSADRKTVRQAPFYVVNSNKIPSVLVEVGYLSHPKERALLLKEDHQHKIAEQIFHGLQQFKEFMDKRLSTDLE